MPNDMPGAARYVRTNMAVPTALVGQTPTWRGNSMRPLTVVPQLPGASFDARGRGIFPLSEPGRFPRGVRISGQRGTADIWAVVGLDGTARTLCYLTDDVDWATTDVVAVRLDTANRPILEITRPLSPFKFAGGTLSASGPITNSEDVMLDTKTYIIETALTNTDGNVLQGATEVETLANLAAAITLGTGKGTLYAADTTLHPTVTAESSGNMLTATAKAPGVGGNSIVSTENCLSAQWINGATFVEGAGAVMVVAMTDPTQAPAASNIDPGTRLHIRLTWNTNPASGEPFASFTINGEAIPASHWTTAPSAPWPFWQMTHLVLGAGLAVDADEDFNGTIEAVQLSETVTP